MSSQRPFDPRGSQPPNDPAGREALFFVHIPKCAGSSFRQVLKRWFGKGALFLDTDDARELDRAVARLGEPPRAIAGHIPFGLHEGLPVRPWYASIVRHPLDRFVSIYRHARRTPSNPMHPAASSLDLHAFYDFTLADPRARGHTVGIQCYFLSRARTFAEAKPVIEHSYALVAPTERYDAFVEACATRFGRRPLVIPPRNVSGDSPVSEAERALLEPRIRTDHVEDLRLYDHVCETFDARPSCRSSGPRA